MTRRRPDAPWRLVMSLAVVSAAVGSLLLASSVQVSSADSNPVALTGAYELFCPGTPIGDIALNDVTTTATLSPASPNAGDTFNLTDYQTTATLPSTLASAAAAIAPDLSGSVTAQVDATGATPTTLTTGTLNFDVTIPSPVPDAGVPFDLPSTPTTLGPFTATSGSITITQDSSADLTLSVAGEPLSLACSAYPNNSVPSGPTTEAPSGSPISPVIAVAGGGVPPTTTPTTTPASPGGPYELYCPGTPIGDIALNDVTTTATLSPASPNAGDTVNVTGYQTSVVLPSTLATAAAALSPTLAGSATGQLDVSGLTPATLATGTEDFSVTIPSPVPDGGVTLTVPSSPATLGPFTASGEGVTVQEDSATSLTLMVGGSPLTLTCTSYPNDTIPTDGLLPTGTPAPSGPPLAPVIAVSLQSTPSTSTASTSTSTPPTTPSTTPTTATTLPPTSTPTSAPPASSTTSAGGDTSSTTSPPSEGTPSSTTSTAAPGSTTTSGSTTTTAAPGTTTTARSSSTTQAAPVTTAATGAGGGGGGAQPVTAPSSSLAFTGASSGLGWVGVLGVVLIAAGLVMFVLVDGPRRVAFRMALIGPTGGLTPEMARRLERVQRPAQRVSRWLLGR